MLIHLYLCLLYTSFLGQHFLKDLKVAQDIADTVDTCPELPVLEVGPGMGVLTQFLVKKDRLVKVVEVDYESVAQLGTPLLASLLFRVVIAGRVVELVGVSLERRES